MADIFLGNLGGSGSQHVKGVNGTDKVEIGIIDDYSKIVVKKTTSAGVESFYEVAIAAR